MDLIIAITGNIQLEAIFPCDWTDHHCITFLIADALSSNKGSAEKKNTKQWKRSLRNVKLNDLAALSNTILTPQGDMVDVQVPTDHYNSSILSILDSIAPLQFKRRSTKNSKPWFNDSLNAERSNLRLAERAWRFSLSSDHLKRLKSVRNIDNKRIRSSKLICLEPN